VRHALDLDERPFKKSEACVPGTIANNSQTTVTSSSQAEKCEKLTKTGHRAIQKEGVVWISRRNSSLAIKASNRELGRLEKATARSGSTALSQ
jgi:hypothetical protein